MLFSVTGGVQAQSQPGLVEVIREAGNFTSLLQALEATNLTDTLATEGPFTVFAPTDEAFAALPPGTLEDLFANPEALRNVLSYHVVEGAMAAADLANMAAVSTLQGAAADISVAGETVMIGGATVLNADIEAANGVVHTIDTVLIPPVAMMEAEPAMSDTPTTPEGAMMAEGVVTGVCAENYVVQANDTLSQIASKYFGNPGAYSAIVEATNAAAAAEARYAAITNPNVINVGQTLCIPGSTATTPATSPGGAEAPMSDEEAMVTTTIPEGMGLVLFENLSSFDLVIDFSGPTPDSLVVPPGATQEFFLEPGEYGYNGHQPGGGFDVAPGQFELAIEQAIQLTCYDFIECQVRPLNTTE